MKSLYLRIWLTIVALLALFALAAGLLFNREVAYERRQVDRLAGDRVGAWAELIQRSLPPADAPRDQQALAVREWSQRLRIPMALDDAQGERVASSDSFERRMQEPRGEGAAGPARDGRPARPSRAMPVKLEDGRTLWIARPGMPAAMAARAPQVVGDAVIRRLWPWPQGLGIAAVLSLLFVGVAAGAYPVVRRLTRRLEALKRGVEQFGAGNLKQRVDDAGRDEVAAVAKSFNEAAARVQSLVQSHQSLLANASHELRSPLARLKMAVSMLAEDATSAAPAQRERLMREIHTNIAELDGLVDEVLLASRLDAHDTVAPHQTVHLDSLLAEEAARTAAQVLTRPGQATQTWTVQGDERLLRRAIRNLLENAGRYGGGQVEVWLSLAPTTSGASSSVNLHVADRGPGVPAAMRERIFEPFFRLPGHAEREGGVGLGLSLVKQIAERHQGQVRCEARDGGGSEFVLQLPCAASNPG